MKTQVNNQNRRNFIAQSAIAAAAVSASPSVLATNDLHLSTNQYSWHVFYQREKRSFVNELDHGLGEVASCNIQGFEASASSPEDIDRLAPLLKKHKLEMRSLYVNSVLHDKKQADNSIQSVMEIAKRTRDIGTNIIVTNPSPIRWGGDEAKTDDQLKFQAEKLSELGGKFAGLGITLAYHNHDAEMKHSAREFHHMMASTSDEVTLCLDSHWVFRGASDSQVALFDIVKLYGKKITELHLRQSHGGVWSETFTSGDIDYQRLADMLLELDVKPHLVLEVAVENGTPHTMNTAKAHQQSADYARKIFKDFV